MMNDTSPHNQEPVNPYQSPAMPDEVQMRSAEPVALRVGKALQTGGKAAMVGAGLAHLVLMSFGMASSMDGVPFEEMLMDMDKATLATVIGEVVLGFGGGIMYMQGKQLVEENQRGR